MSLPATKATSTSIKLPEAQRTTEKAEQSVDARLRRLKAETLPECPYILHVRSTYRQSPEHANLWRIGTHFDLNEEELQYLTFKDRTNDLAPGLSCRGGWDDGKGGLAPPEESYSRTSSDGTPLQGQGQKKKISLADYNKRDRNKAIGAKFTRTSPKAKEQQRDKTGIKESNANIQGLEAVRPERHGQKRSADESDIQKDPNAPERFLVAQSVKKARMSEPPISASADPFKVVAQRSNVAIDIIRDSSNKHTLKHQNIPEAKKPPTEKKTGPTGAPLKWEEEVTNLHGLPPMLSPTLPLEIEEELARLNPSIPERIGSVAKSKNHSATSKLKQRKIGHTSCSTDDEAAQSSVGAKGLSSIKGTTKNATDSIKNQPSQSQMTSARRGSKNIVPKGVIPTKPNEFLVSPVAAPVTISTTPQRTEKRRLRALLKIKKKTNRRNIAQYLRLPPTPGKYPYICRSVESEQRSRTPQSESRNAINSYETRSENSAKSKRNDLETAEAGEKRCRSPDRRDEPEVSVKRHKTPGWHSQNTRTPKQSSNSSPAPSTFGSAPRPQLLTPKADTKSAPMLRTESREGSTTTPRGLVLSGTPSVTISDAANKCNSVTSSGGRKPSPQDVKRDASKYLRQATDLKHAADVFLRDMSNITDSERKRGVMIGTESVLCYILAFTLFDEPQRQYGQYGNIDGWKSMLRLLDLFNREAQPFKHLAGLLLQLEGIIRDYMVCYGFQRLDYNPLEQKLYDTPVEDSTKTKEEQRAAAYHASFHEFRRYFERSQIAWRSGVDLLKVSDIESEYPLTWAKREQHLVLPVKSTDAIVQGEYQRKFNLPMGPMTSGLQAVNFGMNFLEEWSKKNGVKWEPKLEL